MIDYCPHCRSDDVEEFFNGDYQCLECQHCWNGDDVEEEDHE